MENNSINNMMRIKKTCILFFALLFAACSGIEVVEDEDGQGSEKLSTVRVFTRAASSTDKVYPLKIYAFDESGRMRVSQVVNSDKDKVNLRLPQGEPARVVAISANENTYDLPQEISLNSLIKAKSPQLDEDASDFVKQLARGYATDYPLQMAVADIVPSSATAALDLQMHYQMSSLKFRIVGLPVEKSSAYVTVSSPYEGVTLGGERKGSQRTVVPLAYDSKLGCWNSGAVYIFPTSNNQTNFTIAYNNEEGENFAQVTYMASLQAGQPYEIYGLLQDGDLNVSGSVTPAKWATPIAFSFDFSSNSSTILNGDGHVITKPSGSSDEFVVDAFPKELSVWEDHVVMGVKPDSDGNTATLLLVSLKDYADVASALHAKKSTMAASLAEEAEEGNFTSWRIPTGEDAMTLRNVYLKNSDELETLFEDLGGDMFVLTDGSGKSIRYLCNDAKMTYSFKTGTSYGKITDAGATVTSYHLRLVTDVKVRLKGGAKN